MENLKKIAEKYEVYLIDDEEEEELNQKNADLD